ncbi:MAG: LuxR C-terminal-related transcriptional regulator [Arachnia sp.]
MARTRQTGEALRRRSAKAARALARWEADVLAAARELETRTDLPEHDRELIAHAACLLGHASVVRGELTRFAAHGDLPARVVPSPGDAVYLPSPREREVLSLLTLGLTSRQIAHRLEISERTVRKHLDSVYRGAHLAGRAAASAWWERHLMAGA